MSGVRLEPPASAPPPTHPPPEKRGSLASGIGLAWLVVLVGEGLIFGMVPFLRSATAFLLPPLAVAAWAVVLLCGIAVARRRAEPMPGWCSGTRSGNCGSDEACPADTKCFEFADRRADR